MSAAADRLVWRVTLWLRSPFLFRGLGGGLVGVDVAHLRNEAGAPILPADQLRGVLREAVGDLARVGAGVTAEEVNVLFGRVSAREEEGGAANEPARTAILFDDLTATGACMVRDPTAWPKKGDPKLEPLPSSSLETTRIEIDDALGSVKQGALQVIELVAPFGAAVRFTGEIVVFRPAAEKDRIGRLLANALGLVASIGAFKSPGFGEVLAERSTITFDGTTSLALPTAVAVNDERDILRLRVRFDRPILVDADKVAGNAFLGSPVVPGTVFKGALARRLELAGLNPERSDLGKALSALSLSHAFPESRTAGEPYCLPLPLSMVAVGTTIGDALCVPLGCGAMIGGEPALFSTDWKPKVGDAARTALGVPPGEEPPGLARTHTEVRDGVARDRFLYTTIARSVRREDGSDRTWLMDVDLGRVTHGDRGTAQAMIAALLTDGLDGIGKTAAHARFEVVERAKPPTPRPIHGCKDRYAVVLMTPALMLDPARIWTTVGTWQQQDPHPAYKAYFEEFLPGAVLHRFYAAQQLTGGYMARRRRLYGGNAYFPFVLTTAGSVFEIETTDTAGLERLCRFGLPVVAFTEARGPVTWETCPYLPENGYGRIRADHLSTPEQACLLRRVTDV